LFGREAEKLEHANDDERTYYIIEKQALMNTFISVPRDKGSLNCAIMTAGIIEAILNSSNFVINRTVSQMNLESSGLISASQSVRSLASRNNLHDQVRRGRHGQGPAARGQVKEGEEKCKDFCYYVLLLLLQT